MSFKARVSPRGREIGLWNSRPMGTEETFDHPMGAVLARVTILQRAYKVRQCPMSDVRPRPTIESLMFYRFMKFHKFYK